MSAPALTPPVDLVPRRAARAAARPCRAAAARPAVRWERRLLAIARLAGLPLPLRARSPSWWSSPSTGRGRPPSGRASPSTGTCACRSNDLILRSVKNSLIVATLTTARRHRRRHPGGARPRARHEFRGQAARRRPLLYLPIIIPEIVIGAALVTFFGVVGLRLSLWTVVIAHVVFCDLLRGDRRARAPRRLRPFARGGGPRPRRAGRCDTFRRVTLPLILPGIVAGALLVFTISIDDYVITSFVAGVGATTLPLQIYSMLKVGVTPEVNAVSTLLLVAHRRADRRRPATAAGADSEGGTRNEPIQAALSTLARRSRSLVSPLSPARGGCGAPEGRRAPAAPRRRSRQAQHLHLVGLPAAGGHRRVLATSTGIKVNFDLYDSNEALLEKLQSGVADYDLVVPSDYMVKILVAEKLIQPLDHARLPNIANLDPRFLDKKFDPKNRLLAALLLGHDRLRLQQGEARPGRQLAGDLRCRSTRAAS